MNRNTPEYKERLIYKILDVAKKLREDAGYDGRWDDGGAARLEEQVRFYCAGGAIGPIPFEWREYEKLIDPEYETYQRLKEKFR